MGYIWESIFDGEEIKGIIWEVVMIMTLQSWLQSWDIYGNAIFDGEEIKRITWKVIMIMISNNSCRCRQRSGKDGSKSIGDGRGSVWDKPWEMTCGKKVKALGANGEVGGSRVRIVWMVVDGGNVKARLVSREVAKDVNEIGLRRFHWRIWVEKLAIDAMEYDDQDKWNKEDYLQDRMRISVFIIRNEGIGVEMIGMVQGQQFVRKSKVFRFDEFGIHKGEMLRKASKQHSIWQRSFEGILYMTDSFCQEEWDFDRDTPLQRIYLRIRVRIR
nr:hypothetical protein [Tanacetum cinerariifolium]